MSAHGTKSSHNIGSDAAKWGERERERDEVSPNSKTYIANNIKSISNSFVIPRSYIGKMSNPH